MFVTPSKNLILELAGELLCGTEDAKFTTFHETNNPNYGSDASLTLSNPDDADV